MQEHAINKTKRPVRVTEQQKKLAEGYLLKGKSFVNAAVDAGYSRKVGQLGPAYNRSHSAGIDMAFVEASKNLELTTTQMQAVARNRLLIDITNGKSTGCERAIEVLGKFKDLDWFVRTGDIQIGILAGVMDAPDDVAELDPIAPLELSPSENKTDEEDK